MTWNPLIRTTACELSRHGSLLKLTIGRFCHQDEDNDPSADFEHYLTCCVCDDNGMSKVHSLASIHW